MSKPIHSKPIWVITLAVASLAAGAGIAHWSGSPASAPLHRIDQPVDVAPAASPPEEPVGVLTAEVLESNASLDLFFDSRSWRSLKSMTLAQLLALDSETEHLSDLILARWVELDPIGATARVLRIEDERSRNTRLYALGAELARLTVAEIEKALVTVKRSRDLSVLVGAILTAGSADRVEEITNLGNRLGLATSDIEWQKALAIANGDFAAGAQFALGLSSKSERTNLLSEIGGRWARREPRAAAEWVQGLPDDVREEVSYSVMKSIANYHLSDALELLEDKNFAINADAIEFGVGAAFREDQAGTMALIAKMPPGKLRDSVLSAAAHSLKDWNLPLAKSLIDSLETDDVRANVAAFVIPQIIAEDPLRAAELLIDSMPSEEMRKTFLGNHLQNRDGSSDPAIAEFAEALGLGDLADDYNKRAELRSLAASDPAAAATRIAEISDESARLDVIGKIFAGYSAHGDQAAAGGFALELLESGENLGTHGGQRRVRYAAIIAWAEVNADAALAKLGSFQADDRQRLDHAIWRGVANSDPDGALALALSLDAKNLGISAAMEAQREHDPLAAAAKFVEHAPELAAIEGLNDSRFTAPRRLGEALVRSAGAEAAVGWAAQLDHDPFASTAMNGAIREWAEHDPVAASTYLSGLKPGAARDGGAAALASKLGNFDPAAGFAWLLAVREEKRSKWHFDRLVTDWGKEDPDAAAASINASSLPQDQKKRLLEKF